jgi:hypothetical protein
MFAPAPKKPHVYIRILPKHFDPKIPFFAWMEDALKKKYLQGLEYKKVDCCKPSTVLGLSELDLDLMEKQLPELLNKKVFLNLTVPSPSETRNIGHSNTALIDPLNKQIRVNEPMRGVIKKDGRAIEFSPEIIAVLAKKYPGYEIIDEKWAVQQKGEKICNYVTVKIAQHYQDESHEKITREKILASWEEDMNLFRLSQHPIASVHNLHLLLSYMATNIEGHCISYLESSTREQIGISFKPYHLQAISASFVEWTFDSFGYHYKRNDEWNDAALEENTAFESGINYFSDCFTFFFDEMSGQCLSASGEKFIEQLLPLYKKYVDSIIQGGGLTVSMSTEELEQKISEFQQAHPLMEDEAFKKEFLELMKTLMPHGPRPH